MPEDKEKPVPEDNAGSNYSDVDTLLFTVLGIVALILMFFGIVKVEGPFF